MLAAAGAPEGVIVLARQQTAGRRRLGRTWISPRDAGIYMSILLRSELPLMGDFAFDRTGGWFGQLPKRLKNVLLSKWG